VTKDLGTLLARVGFRGKGGEERRMEEIRGGMDERGGKSPCQGLDERERERNMMAQREIKREYRDIDSDSLLVHDKPRSIQMTTLVCQCRRGMPSPGDVRLLSCT